MANEQCDFCNKDVVALVPGTQKGQTCVEHREELENRATERRSSISREYLDKRHEVEDAAQDA